MGDEILLETKDLTMEFEGLKALNAVNLEIGKGMIHSIIGPNGSGKTTIFNLVNGIY